MKSKYIIHLIMDMIEWMNEYEKWLKPKICMSCVLAWLIPVMFVKPANIILDSRKRQNVWFSLSWLIRKLE